MGQPNNSFNGGNNMSWDGKTTDGLDIPSGTYYYTINLKFR